MNPGNSQQALAQLQQAQQSAQNPQNLLAQQQQQLGVDNQRNVTQGLRGAIDNTTKLLQQVSPSVMGRTQGSLVTNAQATRQIANEQAPIASNLNTQIEAYDRAARDLSDIESRAQQLASAQYTGQQDRLGYLQNLYNTIYQREQDDLARQQEEKDRQEQIRQFNAQINKSSGSGGGLDLSSLLNKNSQYSATANKAGGTNFSYQGSPITAAQYFNATGGSLSNFLRSDPGSQNAYNEYASGKLTYDDLIRKYPHIFGGV